MKASVVDLRYRMRDVLKALRRNESVEILYHGKTAGIITPPRHSSKIKEIRKHQFFGMHKDLGSTVADIKKVMDELRGARYRDI